MAIVVYNGAVTAGGTDGSAVTADNPILISAERGTVSKTVQLALRATGPQHYLCGLQATGKDAEQVQVSLDGVAWSKRVFLEQVDTRNRLLFLRTVVGAEEDYGVNNAVALQLDYYQPV